MIITNNSQSINIDMYDAAISGLAQGSLQKIDGSFQFTEGPVWHPDGYFLFSDTPANKIYGLTGDAVVSVYLDSSVAINPDTDSLSGQVGSNGLALNNRKELLVCQHGDHAIALLNGQHQLVTLVDEYNGKPFNSPNDIIVRTDDTIYFTDPPYGLKDQRINREKFQPVAGVYKWKEGTIELVADNLQYPNGLFFLDDEQHLFVSSNHPADPGIVRYSINVHGQLSYDGVFLNVQADGMTVDKQGHIYLATSQGILIVSADAKKLGCIRLPDTPTNLAWDHQNEQLLITAGTAAYLFINKPISK